MFPSAETMKLTLRGNNYFSKIKFVLSRIRSKYSDDNCQIGIVLSTHMIQKRIKLLECKANFMQKWFSCGQTDFLNLRILCITQSRNLP